MNVETNTTDSVSIVAFHNPVASTSKNAAKVNAAKAFLRTNNARNANRIAVASAGGALRAVSIALTKIVTPLDIASNAPPKL